MARSKNAQLAVDLFDQVADMNGLNAATAWKGIAELLLTCENWSGKQWCSFHDVVLYREVNDFKPNSTVLSRAENLTSFLAGELSVPRSELCSKIGKYWKLQSMRTVQPHNPGGHAFRSLLVRALEKFGDKEIKYEEEVRPTTEFPGHPFPTRSKQAKIDIIAKRSGAPVALISSRWRLRHDRIDVVDEAMAYAPAARRQNQHSRFYVWVGEFDPSRLIKVLDHCPPAQPHAVIDATVHFEPTLISQGLGVNGRTAHLKSLKWLISESFGWS